ncbi:MAG: hypothetical protein KGP28_08485 [Bdellovibrionales bacterium]|nr:hypothetical protein [Bdellovibrionales bacterium]
MKLRNGWGTTFAFFLSLNSVEASQKNSRELCSRERSEIIAKFEAIENRIGFRNDGGLFDGGVCWWHSRLQRSSIYLARFEPGLPRPSRGEAKTIIENLVRLNSVVTIPGYSNFNSFSRDYQELIQQALNEWQLRDGFIQQQWIRGLYGRPSLPPAILRERMSKIFVKFKESKPGLWIMAQFPGITSHSLLLLGMTRTSSGFDLKVIDSNRPEVMRTLIYRYGDRSIQLGNEGFTPFVGFQSDQEKIDATLRNNCQNWHSRNRTKRFD